MAWRAAVGQTAIAVCAQGEGLDEVPLGSQAAGDDEGHAVRSVAPSRCLRARARAGMVGTEMLLLEDLGGGAGPAAAAVEDEVVHADLEGEVDVVLDVLCGELEADRGRPP